MSAQNLLTDAGPSNLNTGVRLSIWNWTLTKHIRRRLTRIYIRLSHLLIILVLNMMITPMVVQEVYVQTSPLFAHQSWNSEKKMVVGIIPTVGPAFKEAPELLVLPCSSARLSSNHLVSLSRLYGTLGTKRWTCPATAGSKSPPLDYNSTS